MFLLGAPLYLFLDAQTTWTEEEIATWTQVALAAEASGDEGSGDEGEVGSGEETAVVFESDIAEFNKIPVNF